VISEEKRREIISMWKKDPNISKISRVHKISRPTIRKIITDYKVNRKFWFTRTRNEDGVERFIINTWRRRARSEGTSVERLAAGVEHWELRDLLRSFIKSDTAYEIWNCYLKDTSSICVLHVKESELIPEAKI
jgi:hypothetical protein